MNRRVLLVSIGCAAAVCTPLGAQQHPAVQAAVSAYQELDFEAAAERARQALSERLGVADQVAAFEILAFAYATLDSTVEAVNAFREMILLNPDREPDPNIVSTKITSLYALAYGQVLVVRGVRVDSAAFVAGQGAATVQFAVSRPASVTVSAIGASGEVPFASLSASGTRGVRWNALDNDGNALPPGQYQVRVRATAGRDAYDNVTTVRITHGAVDTLAHLVALEGYDLQPETEIPPRSIRPLGLSLLSSGLATGAALLLQNTALGDRSAGQLIGINAAALAVGLTISLRRPPPRPVESNIRYNRLVAEQLLQENERIAERNAERRRTVVITVRPAPPEGP